MKIAAFRQRKIEDITPFAVFIYAAKLMSFIFLCLLLTPFSTMQAELAEVEKLRHLFCIVFGLHYLFIR